MLYHCLKICRILLKLYIQSTEQMWLWAHMPFSTSCFTVAEHRLGVTASAHRILEAAARSCSRPEYAPVSPSRSPEHTACWCASAKLTGHSGTITFCSLTSLLSGEPPFLWTVYTPSPASYCPFHQQQQEKGSGALTSWLFRVKAFTEPPEVVEIFRQGKPVMAFYLFLKVTGHISFTVLTLLHIGRFFTLKNQHTKLSFSESNFSNVDCLTISLILFTQLYEIHAFSLKLYIWCLSKIWGFFWARKKKQFIIYWCQEGHTQQISKHISLR